MDTNEDPESVPEDVSLPIVGVGASAGGVQALKTFFEAMPPKPGAAFVVIVHLEPDTRSELPQILALRSRMPVHQVSGTTALTENCIYVIPPDRELRITDHEISATPFTEPRGHRAPIDFFFRSLAEQHGDDFAVILTGAGSDGAAGVKAIKEAGGIVFVQAPEEAEYPSMPRSAIATEAADFVLPIREIAEQLVELLTTKKHVTAVHKLGDEGDQLRRVLAHVRVRTGHDFSHYKRSTVMRRILRRMQVSRKETIEEYFTYMRDNAEESQALLTDLLISVTTFFRDPKAFEALAKTVIPQLFADKVHDSVLRVWVPGCATGEEAYSIAILLLEEASRHDLRPEMQVFGSDMDARALAIAREGRYPVAIEADLNEDRLRRFFTRDGEHYCVKRELRDVLLFANHSVLKDPPFSRLDLISCRNLLIYLDRDLQQQFLATLHYGLTPDGYLFLGSSESAESPEGLFRIVDRDARIYQSTGRRADELPVLPRIAGSPFITDHQGTATRGLPTTMRATQAAHREALESRSPPSVLVDNTFRVLHLSETAGRYLQPSAGPLTSDVVDLVRQEMRFELRGALHRAFEQNGPALTASIPVRFNGAPVAVFAQVKPLIEADEERAAKRALVFFLEGEAHSPLPQEIVQSPHVDGQTVQQLRQELELAQTRLRKMHEESEAANEELRAANEELQSINEEYRSTAEELETSREELQSINEELQTVNSELKLKLETVSRANSDLQNLMAATDIATLFLDPGLRIKRFTPKLTEIFNITLNDVGRPITDFTHQLDYGGLPADVRKVLENLSPIEREVRSRSGGWYLTRFRPYRTVDDKIDGVVATFLEVTERRRMEDALRASEQKLRQETRLVELSHTPIFVWEFDGVVTQWNRGSEALYGYTKNEAVGQAKETLLKTQIPGSSFESVKQALLKQGSWKGEVVHTTKDGRALTVETQIELIGSGEHRLALESTHDMTVAKVFEQRMRFLLRELTHRVKNTLAVMQSIVRQTWRSSKGGEDFMQRLEGRIGALSNAHSLLANTDWQGADLHELAQSQMGSYIAGNPAKLHLEGEPIRLPSSIATPFGLVLHELATNAAKYGALSADSGRVHLSWQKDGGNKRPVLNVVWEEHDGPPVTAPKSRSFGSRLIETGVPGAKVHHEFLPDGVRCKIQIPLQGPSGDGVDG
jgi:two-component system CheB/CheR fusion protein